MSLTRVEKTEFDGFIKNYDGQLESKVCTVVEPPFVEFNDDGAVVAKVINEFMKDGVIDDSGALFEFYVLKPQTKEVFEKAYIDNSDDLSKSDYDQVFVTLQCECDRPDCPGWAVVSNNELSIKAHNDHYGRCK